MDRVRRFLVLDEASGIIHVVWPGGMPPHQNLDGTQVPGQAACDAMFWWVTDKKVSLPINTTSFRGILVLVKGTVPNCMSCLVDGDDDE